MLTFTGAASPRTAAGFAHAVAIIGCEPAALTAVLSVEAAGKGFDTSKRPKMLFEPHIFYVELAAPPADKAKLKDAVAKGVAYPKRGTKPYPKDSYPRLALALAIDETKAIEASSWGAGQIMGGNYLKAGFHSPQEMVAAFVAGGEDAQLAAMAKLIVAFGLAVDLRLKKWALFARGYNGPAYAENHYDTKLAAAYAAARRRSA